MTPYLEYESRSYDSLGFRSFFVDSDLVFYEGALFMEFLNYIHETISYT